jgi:hypothetical protein
MQTPTKAPVFFVRKGGRLVPADMAGVTLVVHDDRKGELLSVRSRPKVGRIVNADQAGSSAWCRIDRSVNFSNNPYGFVDTNSTDYLAVVRAHRASRSSSEPPKDQEVSPEDVEETEILEQAVIELQEALREAADDAEAGTVRLKRKRERNREAMEKLNKWR